MDLFTSRGCDFLKVDVGFKALNKTSVFNVGFWYYTSHDVANELSNKQEQHGDFLPFLFPECHAYPEEFYDLYIDDPSWRATKIIAWASAIGSLVSLVSAFICYTNMIITFTIT